MLTFARARKRPARTRRVGACLANGARRAVHSSRLFGLHGPT